MKPHTLFLSILFGLAASSCRIVSTYQPAPPILATPSSQSRGDIAFTTNLINLPYNPLFGLTTVSMQAWVRPTGRFIIGLDGFYWHDQSKFRINGNRLSADLGELNYSGATNGVSGGLFLGTFWERKRVTWVVLGGYSQEHAFSSHNARYLNDTDTLRYNTRRFSNWGKPFAQGHMMVNLTDPEKNPNGRLYFMLGYRLNFVAYAGGKYEPSGLAADIEQIRKEYLLRFAFAGPEGLALMHQPFLAFKGEGRRVSGGIRLGLNIGGNKLYWHHAPYSVEPMIAFKF